MNGFNDGGKGEAGESSPVQPQGGVPSPATQRGGGFGPQRALSYDSGAGNGPFGFGSSLSLPAITCKTDKGLPQYHDADESDVFLLSGAEDLVPALNQDGTRFEDDTTDPDYFIHRYRPRIEGLFARIERWTRQGDADVHRRSISKDYILTIDGKDAESRIADPRCTANRYLKRIRYGNCTSLLDNEGHRPQFLTDLPAAQTLNVRWMFEVVFDYGEHGADAPRPDDSGPWDFRADPFSTYRAGFEVRTTRLCRRVLMSHHFNGEAASAPIAWCDPPTSAIPTSRNPDNARNPVYTFLDAATTQRLPAQRRWLPERSLPPVEFEYTQPAVQDKVEQVDPATLKNLPNGVDGAAYQWTDLHGEGIPGILTEQANVWFYKRNVSPIGKQAVEFAPLERVATKPNLALAAGAQFMDLAGNGKPDLVMLDGPTPGLDEHDGDQGWQPFQPLRSRLNCDARHPPLRRLNRWYK